MPNHSKTLQIQKGNQSAVHPSMAVHQATVLTLDLRLTMQGMKKVMMIAVMTTAFTMTVIVMIHTIVVTTTTIVKMIATDSTLRNSILTIVITKV